MTQTQTIALQSLGVREAKTYLMAAIFIAGNIVLPQLCHLFPQGGLILLPIYFFTLIAAYRYGIAVGLLTALGSPLANSLLFGMPPAAMVPIILVKGTLLALAASFAGSRARRASILAVAAVVVAYQALGTAAEWLMSGSAAQALQDIRLGYPGMLLQIVGGYLALRYLYSRRKTGARN